MCVVKHPVLKNQAAWMFSSLRQLAEKRQTEKCSHFKKKLLKWNFLYFCVFVMRNFSLSPATTLITVVDLVVSVR